MTGGYVLGLLGETQGRPLVERGCMVALVRVNVILGTERAALWDAIPWAWVPGERDAANEPEYLPVCA